MARVVVIGAGVGGLTTATVLARAGHEVTVLEAQALVGGCASTFERAGYRFDAGATLAVGFGANRPMERLAGLIGVESHVWRARPASPVMVSHLPGGRQVTRWADSRAAAEHAAAFGPESAPFFAWQERTADALWDLAARLAPWPPQTASDGLAVARAGLGWVFGPDGLGITRALPLVLDAVSPAARRLRGQSDDLQTFVDGQLLISAQLPSEEANCLYAAAALDLPRAGAAHCEGGVGTIAETIAAALVACGGQIRHRTEAVSVVWERGRPAAVLTADGESIAADTVVANTTPWDARRIFGPDHTRWLRRLPPRPEGNGAFMLYVGIDGAGLPEDLPLHHQVIKGRPYGNANTVFASLSPAWDMERAPAGQRALTLSTHTPLQRWWDLHSQDRTAYDALRLELTDKVLETAERAIPGLRERVVRVFSATPITFERFTHREAGWVGGFPQRSLLSAQGPRVDEGAWLVGDSISPGQSTAAVVLSGMRVASIILAETRS